jgi:hypothetical protein
MEVVEKLKLKCVPHLMVTKGEISDYYKAIFDKF